MTNRWLVRGAWLAVLLVAACEGDPVEVTYPAVDRVEVGPGDRVLAVGDTMRLTAYPRAADGTVLGSVQIAWRSASDEVARVEPRGAAGTVRAISPGTARIEAVSEGRIGWVVVHVVEAREGVASVEIVPASVTLVVGQQQPLEVVARAADGTVIGGRAVQWSSGNAAAVTVTSHGNDAFAMAAALAPGSARVRATVDGVVGEAAVTAVTAPAAVHSITLTPADTVLAVGQQVAMKVVLRAADGSVLAGRHVNWTSSAGAYASVDAYGNVRAHAPGVAEIRAHVEHLVADARVEVRAPQPPPTVPVAYVYLSPARRGLWENQGSALEARTLAANGIELFGRRVDFSVDNAGVARLDATGRVQAVSAGLTRVAATSEGRTGYAEVAVYRIEPRMTFTLTYDWFDGQIRLAEPMGVTTYTDAQGAVREATLYAWDGSFTIDRTEGTYLVTIRAEAHALMDGELKKVGERTFTDRGAIFYRWDPLTDGATTFDFVSADVPGLVYRGAFRSGGELVVGTPTQGGQIRNLLFRLPRPLDGWR